MRLKLLMSDKTTVPVDTTPGEWGSMREALNRGEDLNIFSPSLKEWVWINRDHIASITVEK